jgi:hypothetical protein
MVLRLIYTQTEKSPIEFPNSNMLPTHMRALFWLPPNGAWRVRARSLAGSVSSLCSRHPDLAEFEWGAFDINDGMCRRYRLTAKGQFIRERLARKYPDYAAAYGSAIDQGIMELA